MPFVIRKNRNSELYKVSNAITGRVHSYHTTKSKAQAQVRILESIEKDKPLRLS
jgi:hypothetical protein